ncbi:MAG TPA: SLC13 family permease, partial [Thermoanaerobaculia bacterium]|nr:SLC13 family permease [Thermoanaerobaculia bacterium]
LPVDVTALCLLFALLATGIVPLEVAIAGFSNKSVLTIGGLFILSHALMRTGLLEVVGERLSSRFGKRRWAGIAVLLGLVALMSGFLNNTAVVAMTIPLAVELCRRLQVSPSKVLMPLSFAAIFGGTLTLIGTSTNLLVSALVEEAGEAPLGMFEFTPLGIPFLVVGLGYVLLRAPRSLPERAKIESLTSNFEMGAFLTELRVVDGSRLIGKTVRDIRMSERYDVIMLAVIRGAERISENLRAVRFQPGDVLLVRGGTPGLMRLRNETGVALLSDVALSDEELAGGEQVVVEALVSPNSDLIGRTLHDVDFRRSYGAFVLAIRRQAATLRERLARTPLRFADTLLIVASQDRLGELQRNDDLLVTSQLDLRLRRERHWWLPLALVPAIMVLAAAGVVDLLVGVMGSVVLLLALGVIRPQESYRAVEWRVIFFIAAFIPVGDAMLRTGLADVLAAAVLAPAALVPEHLAPWVAVSALYLVTSVATETVTNNAAAIVLTPVALSMAAELGIDHRALVFAVCFAASASFLTPTGYQTNMMVYGAGNYRFTDFTKFGAPLNVLFWIVASLLIPVVFPFR